MRERERVGTGRRWRASATSASSKVKGEQIVLFNCLDLHHKAPDSGELQCKHRT
jgi:hypothetical protein